MENRRLGALGRGAGGETGEPEEQVGAHRPAQHGRTRQGIPLARARHAARRPALRAAILGLGLNHAAYEAEAQRAGIQAVPRGQWDAARAAAMGTALALRRVVLPQAVCLALPNVTSVALMKDTSLVSVITVVELTKQMTITAVDVRSWLGPGLLCAAFYLVLSLRLARRLEARRGIGIGQLPFLER